ncbi:MAG: hypothetical protein PHU33_16475 [Bacteroidales bacterium]|nr:hypothetical protein [Bacteroidales bacterium]
MTQEERRIIEALAGLGKNAPVFLAEVTDNHPDESFIDVKDFVGDTYNNVRKKADIVSDTGVIITPALGSTVAIMKMAEGGFFVFSWSKIESVKWYVGDSLLNIDKTGLHIQLSGKCKLSNSGQDLKSIMDELIEAIKAITVTTSTGPSGPPINSQTFVTIAQKINNLFE